MRAIAPCISLVAIAACAPNLSRSEGTLDVVATGVGTLGDRVEFAVVSGDTRYSQAADVVAREGRVHVETVPAGAVGVMATLFLGATRVATREGGGVVRAGEQTVVALDFGAGGTDAGVLDAAPGFVDSAPQTVTPRAGPTDVRGGTLTLTARLDHDRFEQFRLSARVVLGTRGMQLTVTQVELELLPTSTGVTLLDQVFTDRVDVTVVDRLTAGARVKVASGSVSGATEAVFPGNGATLDGLGEGLSESELSVELSGATPRASSDIFSADIAARLRFQATPR